MRLWLATAVLLGALVPATLWATPPFRRWSTLRTACCDITYHDGLEDAAPRFARAAQEAHDAITSFLAYTPRERTQILLTDETDSSNGSATPYPYNHIRVFARPPSSFSDLADYDDWARALVLHETTHIIHTDTIHGIPRAVNWVMGKVFPPNLLQPRWFVEGLAVFAETRLTTSGRAQSSLFDMYLRTAALHGRLWDLDVLTAGGRAHPGGNGAYLYGGHFVSWLVDQHGEEILATMSHRGGGSVLPWAMNWVAETTLGQDWGVVYDAWRTDLTRHALAIQSRVEAQGLHATRRLTGMGQTVLFPRLLPDGRVAFYASPTDDSAGLYTLQARPGQAPEVARLTETQGLQGLSPTPDGTALIFSQAESYANAYSYLDLWRLDLATGQVTRLTAGRRLRDPDVHPDGLAVMAVQNRVGASRLVMVDLLDGAVRPLFGFPDGSEIHSPRFSPRGDAVVFTAWRPGGWRDVYLLRVGDAAPTRLTWDRALDMHPCFSADGSSVFFSSDRDGIFNVYRHDLADGRTWRVTNQVTGAFMPVPLESLATLIFVGFGEDAFDLYAEPLDPSTWAPAPPSRTRPMARALPPVALSGPEPYSPLETVLPKTWAPKVRGGGGQGLTLSASVAGEDLVGLHTYFADTQVTLPWGDPSWSLGYQFNGWPVSLYTSTSGYVVRPQVLGQTGLRVPFPEHVLRTELGAVLPLYRWRVGHAFLAAYSLDLRWPWQPFTGWRPDGPTVRLPTTGPSGSMVLGWSHSNVRGARDGVSLERGRRVSLRLRVGHPALLSAASFYEVSGDVRQYFPVPGLPRHVVHLSVQGGLARGDPYRRRTYALGGLPAYAGPVESVLGLRYGGGYLRGYAPGALYGDGYFLGNLEWRFPVLELEQGLFTLPLFLDRVRGVCFLDAGVAYWEVPRLQDVRRGVGAELLVDTVVFYFLPITLRLGVARGLDPGGLEAQVYALLGADS